MEYFKKAQCLEDDALKAQLEDYLADEGVELNEKNISNKMSFKM